MCTLCNDQIRVIIRTMVISMCTRGSFFFKCFYIYVCIYLILCISMCEVVRGQFAGVSSLLLPCGFWEPNPGHHRSWQQASSPVEPSLQSTLNHLKNFITCDTENSELAPLCFSALTEFLPVLPTSPPISTNHCSTLFFSKTENIKWLNLEPQLPYLKGANKNYSCCNDQVMCQCEVPGEVSGILWDFLPSPGSFL